MTPSASPIITIVIPVYNREKIVMRTLDSIEAQTCRDFEVVLVDNNSTDGTAATLARWASKMAGQGIKVTVDTETTPGAAAARNAGYRHVKTPWVMFFDSDDIMLPRHIERITSAIKARPRADIIGWDVVQHMLDGTSRTLPFNRRNALFHNLFHGSMSTQRYCIKTPLVEAAGGWCETLSTWDDIELGNRLLLLDDIVVHRLGRPISVEIFSTPESITGTSWGANADKCCRALSHIKSALPADKRHRVELKRVILAADCAKEGSTEQAQQLLDQALAATPSRLQRALWKLAYRYTCHGGRGAARLLFPLI